MDTFTPLSLSVFFIICNSFYFNFILNCQAQVGSILHLPIFLYFYCFSIFFHRLRFNQTLYESYAFSNSKQSLQKSTLSLLKLRLKEYKLHFNYILIIYDKPIFYSLQNTIFIHEKYQRSDSYYGHQQKLHKNIEIYDEKLFQTIQISLHLLVTSKLFQYIFVDFISANSFQSNYNIEDIDLMRRKSDFTNALTQMFCDDDKKRILAIKSIRDIASAMGPQRVKSEFVPFLSQFLDDDPAIMLAVLQQISNFSPFLGGTEHQKILLPLLINFCSLDEKQVALKAVNIILSILDKHPDAYLDTIKKIAKLNMSVSKESAALLMTEGVGKVPHLEETFLEIYKTLVLSQTPSYRIIGAKHLTKFSSKVSNKEEIMRMIDLIYNDSEDLPKLLTIDTILQLYPINSNSVLSKLKTLICSGTWRVNIRLCEYAEMFSKILSKNHFKLLLEPCYLKMMTCQDNQTRAAACPAISGIAKNMSTDEAYTRLFPIMVKLSEDKVAFVKNEFAKNVVKSFPYFSRQKVQDSLIPMVIKLIKDSNLEVVSSILEDFKQMSNHLNSAKYEEIILKPLTNQLNAQNWRLKISTLQVLGKIIIEQEIYTPFIVDLLMNEVRDKIQATRKKACEIIINMIKNSNKQWCDSNLVPKLLKLKDEVSYLMRQKILHIIDQTVDHVSANTLNQYKKVVGSFLMDRIPNIRVSALKVLSNKKKLGDKTLENIASRLKEDVDVEVKTLARGIKI